MQAEQEPEQVPEDRKDGPASAPEPSEGARPVRPPGPQQIRQQQKHDEKLQDIAEQVADGRLVIRQMTPEERERFPPREPRQRPRSRRSS